MVILFPRVAEREDGDWVILVSLLVLDMGIIKADLHITDNEIDHFPEELCNIDPNILNNFLMFSFLIWEPEYQVP